MEQKPIDLHKIPKIPDIMDELAGQICDSYCKWPEAYEGRPEHDLWEECCNTCPLRLLF